MVMVHLYLRTALAVLALTVLSACDISPERAEMFATAASDGAVATSTLAMAVDKVAVDTETTAVDAVEIGESVTGPAPTNAATAIPATQSSIEDPRVEQLQSYLNNLADSGQFMGTVLIADGGEILLNEGYGLADTAASRANTAQSQLRIGSLTKQFTAAAVLRLQELGRLHVNDPVSSYLPDYPGGEQFTIHQLLTHSAGVPNYTRRSDLGQVVQSPIALPDLLGQFAGQPLDFQPGQQFSYSDSGYVVLTAIIEAVSGMSYADFIRTQIFDPLGMSHSGYDFLRDDLEEPSAGYQLTPGGPQPAIDTESSWASGAGALYSSTQDLYRWDRALVGDQLLNDASREAMFTPWVEMGQGYAYGYGWELGQMAGQPSQTHAGNIFGFASFIARFPDEDATIILLSNGLQMSPRNISDELARFLFAGGG